MAASLVLLLAAVWATTTWVPLYRPSVGEGFRWKVVAWTAGIWILLMGSWRGLDRYRRRPSWIFYGFVSSIALGALLLAIVATLAISASVSIMKPSYGWRGLELFDRRVYYLDRIPVYVDFNGLAVIVVLTLVVSIIFAVYPALRASAANPIEAIRDE